MLLWLQGMFTVESIAKVTEMYHVGENKHGGMQWPYIDIAGRVTEIKIQDHDPGNGHRLKWACRTMHKELRNMGVLPADTRHGSCLFGEHLLKHPDPSKVVCVVESEKTCVMMAMLLPQYAWVATGGSSGIIKLGNIADRLRRYKKVVIIPDSGEHGEWSEKVKEIGIANAVVSRLGEGHAPNTDIADIYVYEWLTHPTPPSSTTRPAAEPPSQNATPPPPATTTTASTPPPTPSTAKEVLTDDDIYMMNSDPTWPFTSKELQEVWT